MCRLALKFLVSQTTQRINRVWGTGHIPSPRSFLNHAAALELCMNEALDHCLKRLTTVKSKAEFHLTSIT